MLHDQHLNFSLLREFAAGTPSDLSWLQIFCNTLDTRVECELAAVPAGIHLPEEHLRYLHPAMSQSRCRMPLVYRPCVLIRLAQGSLSDWSPFLVCCLLKEKEATIFNNQHSRLSSNSYKFTTKVQGTTNPHMYHKVLLSCECIGADLTPERLFPCMNSRDMLN